MPIRTAASAFLALLALTAAPAVSLAEPAATGGPIETITLEDMDLTDLEAVPGVSSGFLIGSFGSDGLYGAQGVMRQGAVFPPHAHPDVRLTVVMSGTMYLGHGTAFDESALVAYPEGTVAITPAGTFHFMAAPDGDVSVLEIGSGPSGASFPEIN